MNRHQAVTITRKYLDTNGFAHLPVKISKTKVALGTCQFRTQRQYGKVVSSVPTGITLSEYWLSHLPDEDIVATIIHEVAHAIAGFEAGHGYPWKAAVRKLGGEPSRVFSVTTDGVKASEIRKKFANYLMVCQRRHAGCNFEFGFDRMTERRRNEAARGTCPKCRSKVSIVCQK
jgi:predicted SprT family Zn-dependent metalloprotease